MDYDSSTKFISSLAKFLQSLCNGYVEFDNGVQVIGHLYLNVDTGKTIDYVLNEKVCKTDENSVTFISNSFHAQPAEKPKPPGKDKTDLKPEELENSNQTSAGTVRNNGTLAGTKRPMSPSKLSKQDSAKSGRVSPRNKRSRTDLDTMNSSHSDSINESSPADPLHQQPLGHDATPFNETYQQNFFAAEESSMGDGQDQRDIKPSFDTDVTFIKEEYAAPSSLQPGNQDDGSQGESSSAYSPSYSNQQFHPGGYASQGSFGGSSNQRTSFNPASDRSMYGSGTSQLEGGEMPNDPSVVDGGLGWRNLISQQTNWPSGQSIDSSVSATKVLRPLMRSFDLQCKKCSFVSTDPIVMANHKRVCNGKRHLTCSICSKVLSRYDALAEHMRGIHGIGEKVECKFCGKNFKYRPQMYQHQAICPMKPPKLTESTALFSPQAAKGEEVDFKLTFPYDSSTSAGPSREDNIALNSKQNFVF